MEAQGTVIDDPGRTRAAHAGGEPSGPSTPRGTAASHSAPGILSVFAVPKRASVAFKRALGIWCPTRAERRALRWSNPFLKWLDQEHYRLARFRARNRRRFVFCGRPAR